MEQNGWEFVHRPDLPPLGKWYYGFSPDGDPTWDRDGNHPVDFDALHRAGYLRPVHIVHEVTYLDEED